MVPYSNIEGRVFDFIEFKGSGGGIVEEDDPEAIGVV
jgi:hypothetical protein